ncbi:fatty acid hydroxylase domain-containing protein 2-like isoform X2 [Mya arenaria]|nr:fatty acid hydroxylase domain-containing protein 2-like isoform X2 [Mya arenaria]XP_052792489.1 fatty acid hydroxylase domain-containing protein 2-like isoform X2 [Mya arenaria]XP_052792490.1 fatty acid hydroxylase domain-containing protein 2-like isoform X2 [Mya arenaria]
MADLRDTSEALGLPAEVSQSQSKGPKMGRIMDSVKKALYIMGSCLLVFAAARNSFHWQIHRLWGATGSFWQSCWDYMYTHWGKENDFWFCCIGTFVVTQGVFWLGNSFFMLLDVYGVPACLLKYKIQEDVKVEMPKLWKAVRQVVFNMLVVGVPFIFVASYLFQLRGGSSTIGGELPTFTWVMLEILIFSFVEEFCFYYSHRLLHHPRLYKHIHKLHHEWTAPISIVAVYTHPVEHVISSFLPPTLGPLIMASHLATAWLWFILAFLSTTISHCGYHLPLLPSPEAHDYHHLKFNQNFGVLGVLDRLHGTDIQFRASKQYQRHVMLLNTVPLNSQYPAEPKKNLNKLGTYNNI